MTHDELKLAMWLIVAAQATITTTAITTIGVLTWLL